MGWKYFRETLPFAKKAFINLHWEAFNKKTFFVTNVTWCGYSCLNMLSIYAELKRITKCYKQESQIRFDICHKTLFSYWRLPCEIQASNLPEFRSSLSTLTHHFVCHDASKMRFKLRNRGWWQHCAVIVILLIRSQARFFDGCKGEFIRDPEYYIQSIEIFEESPRLFFRMKLQTSLGRKLASVCVCLFLFYQLKINHIDSSLMNGSSVRRNNEPLYKNRLQMFIC